MLQQSWGVSGQEKGWKWFLCLSASCQRCCTAPLSCPGPLYPRVLFPGCPFTHSCSPALCQEVLAVPVLGAGSRAAVESLAQPWELDWELSPARVTAEPWPCWPRVAVLGGHEGLSQACPSCPFLPSSPAINSPPCPGCCWSLIQVWVGP